MRMRPKMYESGNDGNDSYWIFRARLKKKSSIEIVRSPIRLAPFILSSVGIVVNGTVQSLGFVA